MSDLIVDYAAAAAALQKMEAQKDGAYLERNRCVALIARMAIAAGLTAGTARTAIEGWSADWHGCVYVDLPTGQTSWHFHDSQAWLFADLPAYTGTWDGHDTPEKYRRVSQAAIERRDLHDLVHGPLQTNAETGGEGQAIATAARDLVAYAKHHGLVLSIEQRPLLPLAMGHHETVVSVRPARGGA